MNVSLRSAAALAPARCGAASVIWSLLVAAGSLSVCSSSARILRTRQTPSERWNSWSPITIGSNLEFETDKEQSQYDFPVFLEYNFTQTLKLAVEPNVVHISPKAKEERAITGVGDLETSLEYEFVRERRYRPALTAESLIRWPTASNRDIGDPGIDYSFGLIASKDLVFVDLDLRALYTFVSDREEQDTFEISLAAQWRLNRLFDIEAEVAHSFGTGGIQGQPDSVSSGRLGRTGADLTEGTVGLAWHVTKRLKIEQGAVFGSDGTWQIVFAWEFSFAGE